MRPTCWRPICTPSSPVRRVQASAYVGRNLGMPGGSDRPKHPPQSLDRRYLSHRTPRPEPENLARQQPLANEQFLGLFQGNIRFGQDEIRLHQLINGNDLALFPHQI